MTFVPGVSAATGAAAAAAAQQLLKEEEEMTPYTREDLAEGWEFKILRSMTNAFGKPDRLRQVLEKESRAGWVLVEKFDNARLRLKRPVTAKEADGQLDFDPYRTYVGISQGKYVWIIVLVSLGVPLLVAGLILLVMKS